MMYLYKCIYINICFYSKANKRNITVCLKGLTYPQYDLYLYFYTVYRSLFYMLVLF